MISTRLHVPVYEAASVDWVIRNCPEAVVVPISADAWCQCRRLGVDRIDIDERLDREQLRSQGIVGFQALDALSRQLDAASPIPLAGACISTTKRVMDSSYVAARRAEILATIAQRVAFIHCEREAIPSVNMFAIAAIDLGLISDDDTESNLSRPGPVTASITIVPRRTTTPRRWIAWRAFLGYWRRFRRWPSPRGLTIVTTSAADDVIGHLVALSQYGVRRLFLWCPNEQELVQIWPVPKRFSTTIIDDIAELNETDWAGALPDMTARLGEQFPQLVYATMRRVCAIRDYERSGLSRGYRMGQAFCQRYPGALAVTGSCGPPQVRGFLQGVRDGGGTVTISQHGGGYGMMNSAYVLHTDLSAAHHYLTYGPALKPYLDQLCTLHGIDTHIHAAGSPALRRLMAGGNRDGAGRIVYAPSNFQGDEVHLCHALTDPLCCNERLQIVQALLALNAPLPLVLKLHPKEGQHRATTDYFAELAPDMMITTEPALAVLRSEDIVVIDWPSTILLQAMALNCRIILYWPAYLGVDRSIITLLRTELPVETELSCFLRRFADNFARVQKQRPNYSEILDQCIGGTAVSPDEWLVRG